MTLRGTTLLRPSLTAGAFGSTESILLRDDGRSRRSLCILQSVRGSEAMFGAAPGARFHHSGLSAT